MTLAGGWDCGDDYVLVPYAQRGAAVASARYDALSLALRGVASVAPNLEIQASGVVFDDHRLRGLAGTGSRSRSTDASIELVGRYFRLNASYAYTYARVRARGVALASTATDPRRRLRTRAAQHSPMPHTPGQTHR